MDSELLPQWVWVASHVEDGAGADSVDVASFDLQVDCLAVANPADGSPTWKRHAQRKEGSFIAYMNAPLFPSDLPDYAWNVHTGIITSEEFT